MPYIDQTTFFQFLKFNINDIYWLPGGVEGQGNLVPLGLQGHEGSELRLPPLAVASVLLDFADFLLQTCEFFASPGPDMQLCTCDVIIWCQGAKLEFRINHHERKTVHKLFFFLITCFSNSFCILHVKISISISFNQSKYGCLCISVYLYLYFCICFA